MRGSVTSSSSMLALRRREHSFQHEREEHTVAPQPRSHSFSVQQLQLNRPRTPIVNKTPSHAHALPLSPADSSSSNCSITSGIHVFHAPSRSGVSSARRLPQFTMQSTPRVRPTLSGGSHRSPQAAQPQAGPSKPRDDRSISREKQASRSSLPQSRRSFSSHSKPSSRDIFGHRRPDITKRVKKPLATVMSATNFYSGEVAVQQRPASFTYGAPGGFVPRAMATPPSPGGSPDPIDAFSSPLPLRPILVQETFSAERDEADMLDIFEDLRKLVQPAPPAEEMRAPAPVPLSKKRSISQIVASDDSDDEPIMKKAAPGPPTKRIYAPGSLQQPSDSHQAPLAETSKNNVEKVVESEKKRGKRKAVEPTVVQAGEESRARGKSKRKEVKKGKDAPQSQKPARPDKKSAADSKGAEQDPADTTKKRGKRKAEVLPSPKAEPVRKKKSRQKEVDPAQGQTKGVDLASDFPANSSSRPRRSAQRRSIVELSEDEADGSEGQDYDDDGGAYQDRDDPTEMPEASKDDKNPRPSKSKSAKKRKSEEGRKVAAERQGSEDEADDVGDRSNPVLQLLEEDLDDDVWLDPHLQPRLSSGKAKGVDTRSPVRRLLDLMAEIFDGEDGLPASASTNTGMCAESALIFNNLQGHHVLRMDILHSLVKLIKLCKATPVIPAVTVKVTTTEADAPLTEPEPRSMAEINGDNLGRLLRIVERTVRAADGTSPFTEGRPPQTGPTKSDAGTASDDAAPSSDGTEGETGTASKKDISSQYLDLSHRLERIAVGVLASECCFEIFTVDGLPASMLSEDILQTCLDTLKLSVNDTILPFVEGCADLKTASTQPLLQHFLQNLVPAPLRKKRGRQSKTKAIDVKCTTAITSCGDQITSVFVRTYAALGALQHLVSMDSVSLSESVLISAIYVSLGPFFAIEPEDTAGKGKGTTSKDQKAGSAARTAIDAVGGTSAMRNLRLPALHLLRGIFARHPEQRAWIVEEVLGSLGKVAGTKKAARQTALRSGTSVNFATTLLLVLVQSSAHGFREHVLAKGSGDTTFTELSPSKSPESNKSGSGRKRKRTEDPAQEETSRKSIRAVKWSMSMEGPLQTASTISAFIMQRVSASKTSKSSIDTAYIAIVESLMADLLEMLFLPEWPGAAILLTRFCISFFAMLNDPQASPEARGIAIDHIGAAAARLRACQLQLGAPASGSGGVKPLRLLRDIINISGELNAEALKELQTSYVWLRNSLGRITDEDRAADSARELLEAQWIAETAAAMTKLSDDSEGGETQAAEDQQALERLVDELKQPPKKVGTDLPRSDEITPAQYKQLARTSHFVLSSSAFMLQFDTLQDHLLDALDRQAVANRAKALRALSSVAAIDADLLTNEEIRWAVEARLEDPSVGVREAAVGLLSRYILQRPKEIELHFEQLVHHAYDSGVSVRKRILRLLADIYNTVDNRLLRADCCVRLIRCVTDEDTGVQDLAVATIAKLWFDVALRASDSKKSKTIATAEGDEVSSKSSPSTSSNSHHARHSDIIAIVASMIRDKPSPMEEVFARMLQQVSEQDSAKLQNAYRELSDSMIDAIVSDNGADSPSEGVAENDPTSMFSRMRTIHLLVSTLPTVLTINRGKALLPFLKSAQTDVEMHILHLLLRVFSAALPSMPRTAIAFAQELERSLMPLINRPRFKSGSLALQELVACYVKVIKLHTHNFAMMIKMFSQCYGRLQFVADHVSVAPKLQLEATNAILIALTTLLCEHADFDNLRQTNATLAPSLTQMTTGSILEGVYTMLVTIYQSEDQGYKAAALQSLGWLFRSYPALMGREDATRTMDEVLAQGDAQQRELLLRSLLEFLNGQQQSRSAELSTAKRNSSTTASAAPVDMAQLVGDTAEFAESSVSSVLLQRYLDRILDASLSVRIPSLQRTAMDILKITVLQGLTHPLQCVPTLIALETSADENVRGAAFHMHSHLATKHGSILAVRYLDHARAAFAFQLSIKGAEQLRGFRMEERPTAALQQWYSLVAEKRQTRLDLLKALVKIFDIGRLEAACTKEDVAFTRFLADNLALFDYTTNEEIMTIVGELRSILSVAGMQTYSAIDDELEERANELRTLSQGPAKKTTEIWIEIESTSHSRPRRSAAGGNKGSSDPAASHSSSSDKILDKARELELARTSTILSFALALRNQLKWLYSLSEARCAKYVPGKKNSAGADKPAVRRQLMSATGSVLELSTFPGAFSSCETSRDALLQMQAYHNAISAEGTILEADEDDNYE
ncbi:hypothetical protein V8E36_000589 [Tilletia maclaganii]